MNGPMRALALLFVVALAGCSARPVKPLIIAHRGASGHRPEHTLAAYELAIAFGADFIEPDLVPTKDGFLVARHENEISRSTDVGNRPEFADRRATKIIDGTSLTGWFTEDFTLAELRTLKVRERIPELRPRNSAFDGLFVIPTFEEVIALAKSRNVGLYPELKHPSYFEGLGLKVIEPLVQQLHAAGFRSRSAPVFIQSFEPTALQRLRAMTSLRLVLLVADSGRPFDFTLRNDPRTYPDLITPAGLKEVRAYADALAPSKKMILPLDAAGAVTRPTSLVQDAHAAGLLVHPYTFNNENRFLPANLRQGIPDHPEYERTWGAATAEYETFFRLGVDGMFSDYPDTAAAVRARVGQTR